MRTIAFFILAALSFTGIVYADDIDDYIDGRISFRYANSMEMTKDLRKIPVLSGTIRNRGNRILSKVEITLFFIDEYDNTFKEKQFYPIKYYKFIVSSNGQLLEPGQEVKYHYPCEKCLKRWFDNYEVEITDIRFFDHGFALNWLYNPFLYLYEKAMSLRE